MAWWSNATHEEDHVVNADDGEGEESTAHAIVIVDENEGETETPEGTMASRTKPHKAKTAIKTRRRIRPSRRRRRPGKKQNTCDRQNLIRSGGL